MSQTILFAGPSLNQASRALLDKMDIECKPPCQRLDIERITEDGNTRCIILVDGLFHQVNSIGYREIREALARDIDIWGLSSIGAIRAYEMRHLGMKGFGQVYDRFYEVDDFQDDEVALLHGPAPGYIKFSEPLIHMRLCMEDLVRKGAVEEGQKSEIINFLKQKYFGDRTLTLFSETLSQVTGLKLIDLDFSQYRQKEHDLFHFLSRKIWLDA